MSGSTSPAAATTPPQFNASGKQIDGDRAEYAARNTANLARLDDAFAAATEARSSAFMIVLQADMWNSAAPTAHFADTNWASATIDPRTPTCSHSARTSSPRTRRRTSRRDAQRGAGEHLTVRRRRRTPPIRTDRDARPGPSAPARSGCVFQRESTVTSGRTGHSWAEWGVWTGGQRHGMPVGTRSLYLVPASLTLRPGGTWE